jgi:anti-sigma28 factor (negative regulator of flagellin synthesis)
MAEAMDLSEVRLEKVIELRAAIATGKYRVSAACVADRLLGRLLSGGLLTGRS